MKGILLFDGECAVCNWSIQFILNRDPHGDIHFASLQGEVGQKLRQTHKISPYLDSVVYIENDKVYTKSSAALRVCRHLNGPVRLLSLFRIMPKPLRNAVYDFIARNRFRWFGQAKSCRLPSREERSRILD